MGLLDPWSNWASAAEAKRKDKIAEKLSQQQLGMAQNREALQRNVGGANQQLLSDLYARVMGKPLAQKPIDWSQPTGAAQAPGAAAQMSGSSPAGASAPTPAPAAPAAAYNGPMLLKNMPMPKDDEEGTV
jgi:hypothetical protein